jgi:hypothetical protein
MRDEEGCFLWFLWFLFCVFLMFITIHLLATYGAPEWLEYYLLEWGVIVE